MYIYIYISPVICTGRLVLPLTHIGSAIFSNEPSGIKCQIIGLFCKRAL